MGNTIQLQVSNLKKQFGTEVVLLDGNEVIRGNKKYHSYGRK